MNQRLDRVDLLAPFLRRPVLRLIELCYTRLSYRLLVVHTFRTVQEQMLIYQQGRTFDRAIGQWIISDQTKIITKAKPGTSPHNVVTADGKPAAVAVDLIPLDPETAQPDWSPDNLFWDDLYELAWKCGVDPLGDPIGSYYAADRGHFEEPAWQQKIEGLGLVLPAPVLTQV